MHVILRSRFSPHFWTLISRERAKDLCDWDGPLRCPGSGKRFLFSQLRDPSFHSTRKPRLDSKRAGRGPAGVRVASYVLKHLSSPPEAPPLTRRGLVNQLSIV